MKIQVYILNNGWMEGDEKKVSALNSNSDLSSQEANTSSDKWEKIPIYAVLIDHPQGKILYDLGCHPESMKGYWPEHLTTITRYCSEPQHDFVHQLSLAGTKPSEIDTIVLSHFHPDHTGSLYLFPHADVYAPRKDFEYAMSQVHLSSDPAKHGPYVKETLEVPIKQYHLVDEDIELFPGVELINVPGHTLGLLGMVVHLEKEGTLIFPQDAVNDRKNYGPPAQAKGMLADPEAYLQSIEKVRQLANKYNAKVMFPHDWEFFQTMKTAPDFYE